MFELTTLPTETRVPVLGDGSHIALSATVDSAPSTEVFLPLRPANMTVLVSATTFTTIPVATVEFVDEHFLSHELNALERRPTAAGYVAVAISLLQTRRYQRAVDLLAEGRAMFDDYWVRHFHSIALGDVGRVSEAEGALSALASENPSDWRPRHALGSVQLRAGQWAAALATMRDAALLPDAPARVFNDLATSLIALGEVSGAMKALRRALALDERYTLAHNNMGVCYRALKLRRSDERAVRSFQAALACDAHCTPAIHNLAECYIGSRDFERVVELLEPHIQTYTWDVHAVERLAWAHFKLGSVRRAMNLLRDAATRSSTEQVALWNNLGIISRAGGHVREAEAAFRLALETKTDRIDVHMNYALLLRSGRRWAEVCGALPEKIALAHPSAATLRATALAYSGVPERGAELLIAALDQFPRNPELTVALGHFLCSYLDAPDQAIEVLQRVDHGLTSHPMVANNLAYALIKAARLSEARSTLAAHFESLRDNNTPTGICVRATWGLLRIREGAALEGLQVYRELLAVARGELGERLREKLLVEEGRDLLHSGQRDMAIRKLKKAASLHVDREFDAEARALLRSTEPPN
jgi:Flp pilus assembly protein TadD